MFKKVKKFFGGNPSTQSRRLAADDPKRYKDKKQIAKGVFGCVYTAKDRATKNLVAIKQILNPTDCVDLEIKLHKKVEHPNVVRLLATYIITDKKKITRCLVLEYGGEVTLQDEMDYSQKRHRTMPQSNIRLYTFQIFRALHYLHLLQIVHRDVKPSNFVINKNTGALKLVDMGSAKYFGTGVIGSSDAVALPYRPPEMLLGNQDYREKVDIWSAGVILAECCYGGRFFQTPPQEPYQHPPPDYPSLQFQAICKIMGSPKQDDVEEMQPLLSDRQISTQKSIFRTRFDRVSPRPPEAALDLIERTLKYKSSERPSAIDACADQYYDQLREFKQYDGILYNFVNKEMEDVPRDTLLRVIPERRHPTLPPSMSAILKTAISPKSCHQNSEQKW